MKNFDEEVRNLLIVSKVFLNELFEKINDPIELSKINAQKKEIITSKLTIDWSQLNASFEEIDIEKIFSNLLDDDYCSNDENIKFLYSEFSKLDALLSIDNPDPLNILTDLNRTPTDDELAITYFKNIGFAEENIKIVTELKDYIEIISTLNLSFLSRGQKDYSFALEPSALRKDENNRKLYDRKDIETMMDEFTISLKHFDHRFEHLNKLEIEAYAQHYGIPTYLLDFTEAHLISLLFALEEYEYKKHSIVYFIDSFEFNMKINGNPGIPNCSNENNCDGKGSCIFIKPNDVNSRIHFQKGYFLRIPERYSSSVIDSVKEYSKIVLISHAHKERILKELFSAGVTFQNIYHDIDNLVKSIKFKVAIRRSNENE